MKKILVILLSLVFVLSLVACNKGGKSDTKPVELGDPVNHEEVYLFDENNKPFTSDTLPDEYKNSDFDSDGLKNKDEIEHKTDMYKVDTDEDGLSDYDEINKSKTNPTKWSSRDDDVSDLQYHLLNGTEFKEGYTSTDANDFKVYLTKPEDNLWIISKTSSNAFDELETISEVFQIKYFSGKIALNCNKYVSEVAQSIAIYKDVDGKATKVESTITENNLVEFNLSENDIFVIVYEAKKS